MASIATDIISLPAEVQSALAAFPDAAAERAATVLRRCLYPRLQSCNPVEWSSSRLTGSGFPLELTFTSADDRLRYTVEPGAWQTTPEQRLGEALRLVRELALPELPDWVGDIWNRQQPRVGLRYGAWLGGRHGTVADGGLRHDEEFKLYVELTNGHEPALEMGDFQLPRLPDRAITPRMIAVILGSNHHEMYYRIRSLTPCHLQRLLAPAGLEERSQEFLAVLADAYGHAMRERLPGASVGISYAIDDGGEAHAVSLFFFARVFWGGDARIRERFSSFTRTTGWDDARYQQVTAPLARRNTWATHHGILGFTLTRSRNLHLSIGVRPPPTAITVVDNPEVVS